MHRLSFDQVVHIGAGIEFANLAGREPPRSRRHRKFAQSQ